MAKIRSVVSQSQVLIYCSSPEEAEKLHRAVSKFEEDTLDDILEAFPALKLELEAVSEDRAKVKAENEKLKTKKSEVVEKPLGAKKTVKVQK